MGVEERKGIIRQIEEKRGSRLLCCLTSDREGMQGAIAKDFLYRFFLHFRTMKNLDKLDVLLFTLGGDTLASYALGRFVRQYAKSIGVLVPHFCLSGGTLFALGADEIIMTRLGTLSAIDPSITGLSNPIAEFPQPGGAVQKVPVPIGVESVAGFKKVVDEWKLDSQGQSLALSLLAQKVNPVLLGDLQRSKEQIIKLATSLMKLHARPKDKEQIDKIVKTLATELGSHDYLLVASEAGNDVGLPISEHDAELEDMITTLYEDFAEEMELGIPFNPLEGLTAQGNVKVAKLVMIESLERSDVWEREMAIIPPGQLQIRRNHWRR
jgi:hypothetical protein